MGYVGLPLAIEFGKNFETIGYDINKTRILELKKNYDANGEINKSFFKASRKLKFIYDLKELVESNIYIITVPTPINKKNKPDLRIIKNATALIAKRIKKSDIIIYESTVYPGCTEEVCVPILEKQSKLIFNKDFFCGYSPERINPGDKKHTLTNIKKIVSGSNRNTLYKIDKLYSSIIKAGVHRVESIKIAEAAKVIENTQRDINIALINELSVIFKKLNIDTEEIIDAASTKWNFLPFKPGLVGGHCIGVDPYYLTYKARKANYNPKVILSGRKINNEMPKLICLDICKTMKRKKIEVINSNVLLLGVTFKENCSDVRNSKVFELGQHLKKKNINISYYDPHASKNVVKKEYNVNLEKKLKRNFYDAIVLCVAHKQFNLLGVKKVRSLGKKVNVIYDIKYLFNKKDVDGRL